MWNSFSQEKIYNQRSRMKNMDATITEYRFAAIGTQTNLRKKKAIYLLVYL
jgi:hypothetical protein